MTDLALSVRVDGDWPEACGASVDEPPMVHLRESRDADVPGLLRRVRSGNYPKPFVVDQGTSRRLHFSLDYVQSEMDLKDPYALVFPYTRKMMAFLLFRPRPGHVVIVGLGGGSLTKFCQRQLPRTRVTTLESNGDVIAFGKLFAVPAPNERVRLLNANAADYFATTGDRADVILMDGCDRHGVAPELCNKRFYRSLRARLRPGGILVVNLIGPLHARLAHLRLISEEFSGRLIHQEVSSGGNRLLFAFNDPAFRPDWPSLRAAGASLARRHGLDFPDLARKLGSSEQLQAVGAYSH